MSQNASSLNAPYLIVGLGNPGSRYAGTRHNAGFMAVDELARLHGLRFSGKQANAEVARGNIAGAAVILAKPLTFMNESGRAVGALARFYKVPPERVLIVCDDVALPLGTIRIREKGSAGGHNGLTSVIQHLGTQSFPRLRIGVDRPASPHHSQIDWVLGHFTRDERKVMDAAIPRAAQAIETILRDGVARAMNEYNAAPALEESPKSEAQPAEKPQEPAKPQAQDNHAKRPGKMAYVLSKLHHIMNEEGKAE